MGADGGERFGDGSPNISLGPGPGLCSFIKNFTVCLSQALTWEVGSSLQCTLRRGQGEDTGAEIRRSGTRGADGAQGEGSVCHFWVERSGGASFGGIGVRACNIGSGHYREGQTQTGERCGHPSADREGDVCRGADRGASEKL